MNDVAVPVTIHDPINEKILVVSEDRVQGFQLDPLGEISRMSGVDRATVLERLQAMLRAGVIRRIRQTLLATNLAQGALVAWETPPDLLETTFDWMFANDPFTGHVVIRSTDPGTAGSQYRLWTTLKVPQGYSLVKHCDYLKSRTGALRYVLLPARKVFALGVGHLRRRGLQPGDRASQPAEPADVAVTTLSDLEWRVLVALKREFTPEELELNPLWGPRAKEAGVSLETFYEVATELNRRRVIGRFSTFLEHTKPAENGERVARFNALFHWAVPPGREIDAGKEVGRHHVMTHAYWRDAGPEFRNVNIMGVAHGAEKEMVLAHKAAIDRHLEEAGIPVLYTNVFWGGRSEIKPSEISPMAYQDWCRQQGLDPQQMREA
ncbi:Lrp/AsnC family transcriptional regulator [Fontisphaera persica]|uniref:Lrp/AsnC family transcriptional regulator n=1 Tax=Fontisphaera persica TaxID=2974023 RepID=UPI0024C0CB86|nr:Lrp/AsnC family transcriptional regulator [Fontisphaera persica]WCJ59818.1 Lrp/AsnC family transcriptional regulator [Fontisphaera persica]